MRPQIENLVQEMNDLIIHVYQFIRLYILHLYKQKIEFPIIDEPFIMSCIKTLGIRDNRGAKSKNTELLKTLDEFYINEYQPLLKHEKTNLRNKVYLLPYIATQIYTNLTVNIQEHFVQHIRRFINITTTEITSDKEILYKFKKQLLELSDTNILFNNWLEEHRDNILPTNIQISVNYDVKVRPFEYLKGLLYMNSILENKESKLFQPLPLRSTVVPKHIVIDSASLVDLFCPQDYKKEDLFKNITNNQDLIWSSMLKTKSKVFKHKHYRFHNQIKTDGISCSLLFIREDLANKKWGTKVPQQQEQEFYNIEDLQKEQLDLLKDSNVIGCDPGKRSLVYMIDKDGNKLQYTSPQRMRESKSKCNKRILQREKIKNNIIEIETNLSKYNSKTVNYEKFKEYLINKNNLNKETKEFYQQEKWRKMSFRSYCYSQKSIDRFLNKISNTFGSNIVIGYGNYSRSTQMKFYEPTINIGLRRLIHKRYNTITINEHNTSKKCCDCHQDLSHHKDSNNENIYRLLKCSNCVSSENKKIVFRTRDVNSAVNIREITDLWIREQKRLPVFCRTVNSSFTTLTPEEEVEKVGPSLLR